MKVKKSLSVAFLISGLVLMGSQIPFISDAFDNTSSQNSDTANNVNLSEKDNFANAIDHKMTADKVSVELTSQIPDSSCVSSQFTGKTVSGRDALVSISNEKNFIPASTNKILTASAILSKIDSQTKLDTSLYASKKSGDLKNAYIKTSGDPSFVSTTVPTPRRKEVVSPKNVRTFESFAKSIKNAGVNSIEKLVIDNTWFKLPSIEKGWEKDKAQVGSIAALNIDEGFENNELSSDPDATSANALKASLEVKGIAVGSISFGSLPSEIDNDNSLIAKTQSATLIDMISEMLKTSDNVYAEQLLAAATHIKAGDVTVNSRLDFLRNSLTDLIGDLDDDKLVNGSGYSREISLSCPLIVKLLQAMSAKGIDLAKLSSEAGKDGTLYDRFTFTKSTIYAKTGTLNGVTGLTGTIDDKLTFSFISNGTFSTSQGHTYQDIVIKALLEAFDKQELRF